MLTLSIRVGAELTLRRAKSCSTTVPDKTSPNSKLVAGKTVLGAAEARLDDLDISWTAVCCEPQETRRVSKAKKPILLAAGTITRFS
jgi:hypothetical protein